MEVVVSNKKYAKGMKEKLDDALKNLPHKISITRGFDGANYTIRVYDTKLVFKKQLGMIYLNFNSSNKKLISSDIRIFDDLVKNTLLKFGKDNNINKVIYC